MLYYIKCIISIIAEVAVRSLKRTMKYSGSEYRVWQRPNNTGCLLESLLIVGPGMFRSTSQVSTVTCMCVRQFYCTRIRNLSLRSNHDNTELSLDYLFTDRGAFTI